MHPACLNSEGWLGIDSGEGSIGDGATPWSLFLQHSSSVSQRLQLLGGVPKCSDCDTQHDSMARAHWWLLRKAVAVLVVESELIYK